MNSIIYRFWKAIVVFLLILVLAFPLFSIAGVDEDLKKNLGHTDCIHSWTYNKSAFKIYLNSERCKKNEAPAALLTIRYIFEANNKNFPKRIDIFDNRGNKIDSYPFERIPSLK